MCDIVCGVNDIYIIINLLITHIPSLFPTFVTRRSSHRVSSGCLSDVALSLVPAGSDVVAFFHFVTMAPVVAIFFMSFISMGLGGCLLGGRLARVQV